MPERMSGHAGACYESSCVQICMCVWLHVCMQGCKCTASAWHMPVALCCQLLAAISRKMRDGKQGWAFLCLPGREVWAFPRFECGTVTSLGAVIATASAQALFCNSEM